MIMLGSYLLRSWHFILMILTNFYCVPAYIVWTCILRPLQYIRPNWYYTAEGVLYSGLIHFISFWVWHLGFTGQLRVFIPTDVTADVSSRTSSEIGTLYYCYPQATVIQKYMNRIKLAMFKLLEIQKVLQTTNTLLLLSLRQRVSEL